ncbi:hypothetical protein SDC9_142262 [bioreactor metagenome]|uniref:Uncharacterized protein n=1 Tax=bioreactor metagenome TaxID=1076179 RepID=A0A645E0M9_9ZZZZ
MANKLKVKSKEYAKLGIRRTLEGNYEYIDPSEKNKSKYEPIRIYNK